MTTFHACVFVIVLYVRYVKLVQYIGRYDIFNCVTTHYLSFQMENILEQWGPLCTSIGVGTAVAGLAATYYVASMPDPNCIPPVDLTDQSYLLEVYF
jgi:hypothetical protein